MSAGRHVAKYELVQLYLCEFINEQIGFLQDLYELKDIKRHKEFVQYQGYA